MKKGSTLKKKKLSQMFSQNVNSSVNFQLPFPAVISLLVLDKYWTIGSHKCPPSFIKTEPNIFLIGQSYAFDGASATWKISTMVSYGSWTSALWTIVAKFEHNRAQTLAFILQQPIFKRALPSNTYDSTLPYFLCF